jgi:hypothetical protein
MNILLMDTRFGSQRIALDCGRPRQFSETGAVPTNTIQRDILRTQDENNWHTGEMIHLLTSLSALLHDLGKASTAFQMRLRGLLEGKNKYRHEYRRHDNDSRGYWEFAHGLPVTDPAWRKRVARIAQRLQSAIPQPEDCFENPYVMHVARLCLMLADHHYHVPAKHPARFVAHGWMSSLCIRLIHSIPNHFKKNTSIL